MNILADRFAQFGSNAVPGLVTLLLVFVGLIPLGIPQSGLVAPPLVLMAVFYWGIYRPDLLPGVAAFAIGLFHDVLGGGALGLYAFIFLVVRAVMASQRRFFLGKPFLVEWSSFALVGAAAFMAEWVLASLYVGAFVRPGPLAIQALLTITLYPVLTGLMIRLRHAISRI